MSVAGPRPGQTPRPLTRPLTRAQIEAEVQGYGVATTTMGELLDERLTLLVFLRHFG